MIIPITILLMFLRVYGLKEFCRPRQDNDATNRNALWYPSNCTSEDKFLGTRCFLKCKDGYRLQEGSLMFTDCIRIGNRDAQWSSLEVGDVCLPSTFCTVPKGLITYTFPCKNVSAVPVGAKCYVEGCVTNELVGPNMIECQAHETWSGGGSYCKEPIEAKITCPSDLTVQTDPHSSTVNILPHMDYPQLQGLNPSGLKVSDNAWNLTTGTNKVTFQAPGPNGEQKMCNVSVIVEDKEAPRLVSCKALIEDVAAPGSGGEYHPTNCTFVDNVDGEMIVTTRDAMRLVRSGNTHEYQYKAEDSSKNHLTVKTKFIVHLKQCTEQFPTDNTKIIQILSGSRVACTNASYNYYGNYHILPFAIHIEKRLFISVYSCDSKTFEFKLPSFDCYLEYPLQNGTCTVGQVPNLYKTFCIPCPKSFFYNSTSRNCQICPVNQTTLSRGSTSCISCPKNSRTTRRLGPIRCEYFCKPGLAYTGSGCKNCEIGEYAEAGGEQCQKCPGLTTTYKDLPSLLSDCVPGVLLSNKYGAANRTGLQGNTTFIFRFNLSESSISTNQAYQTMALQIASAYLSSKTNCSKDYVQLVAYLKGIPIKLTERLCGKDLNKLLTVDYRPWRVHVLHYMFSQESGSDLRFNYVVGADMCSRGSIFNLTTMQCTVCPSGSFQERFQAFECKRCSDGTTNYGEGLTVCIKPCLAGFEGFNGTKCKPCEMNHFRNKSMPACTECPAGLATAHERSTRCLIACSVGEFLFGGQCKNCPRGMYQPLSRHAQSVCRYCPKGNTTLASGANSASDCVGTCKYEGEYYNTTLKSCQQCPKGTYKTASPLTVGQCTQCPDGLTTVNPGSVLLSQCKRDEVLPCDRNNTCKFPGQCVNNGTGIRCICPKYHTGQFCEIVEGPCARAPCGNGTCHPYNMHNYTCLCKPGYTGNNCELYNNPCEPDPCDKGTCTRHGKSEFNCTCDTYWGGRHCNERQGPCSIKINCVNGQCDDNITLHAINNFTCSCHHGYRGKNCDKEINFCEELPCSSPGTIRCNNKTKLTSGRECVCKPGYFGDTCSEQKNCKAGEFYLNKACCKCWHGSYNTKANSLTHCVKCSDGLSTLNRGAISESECLDVSKVEQFTAEIILLGKTYQGPLVQSGCGDLPANFEQKLNAVLQNSTSKDVDVKVNQYLEPPQGKNGLRLSFTVYGDIKDNEKYLTKAVKTGQIDDMLIENDFIKIRKRDVEKEKNHTVIFVVIGTVIGVLFLLVLIVLHKNRSTIWT